MIWILLAGGVVFLADYRLAVADKLARQRIDEFMEWTSGMEAEDEEYHLDEAA